MRAVMSDRQGRCKGLYISNWDWIDLGCSRAAFRSTIAAMCLLFGQQAMAHSGHDIYSFSHHSAGTCIDVASCSALGVAFYAATTCDGHDVRESDTGIEVSEASNRWAIRTYPECLHENGEYWVGPHNISFYWYKSDVPPECDWGSGYLPICPGDEVEYVLEVPEQPCDPCDINNRSNPIDPATGNKYQREVDYVSSATGRLSFVRHFNSRGASKTGSNFGAGWRHSYSASIDEEPDRYPTVSLPDASQQSASYSTAADACTSGWNDVKATAYGGMYAAGTATFVGENVCEIDLSGSVVAYMTIRSSSGWPNFLLPAGFKTISRPNGVTIKFELESGVWVNKLDASVTLEQSGGNWIYTDRNDTKDTFNSSGQLIIRTQRNGQAETLEYALTTAQGGDDDNSTLDRVTGPFGHELTFGYDGSGRLDTVTTPDGAIQYAYDSEDNLISTSYPDSSVRQYHYEYGLFPNNLTGITDENNDRFATWTYGAAGRALSSEHAGGIEKVDFAYNSDGTTTLTMANGAVRHYDYTGEQGIRKLSMLSGDVCSTCPGGDISNRSYDNNGFLYEAIDWNGNTARTTRNSRGLTETRIDAVGSNEERTTTTTWHSTFRMPLTVTTPKNTTTYTYDSNGNALTVTVAGGLKTRAWTFTYNTDGQPLTIDGPRTDVTDLTTLEYYVCSTGSGCGQLKKITNALGHVTNFNTYDNAGRLALMTDPNGTQTSMTYDSRGRVLTTILTPLVGLARTTTMTYDSAGQLTTMTVPDGTTLTYAYNDAHLLQSVTDNVGNYVSYDYNAMGDLSDEDTYDSLNTLKRSMDYARDLNDRLSEVTDGGFTTSFTYDLVGNTTAETDPNINVTQQTFDSLNRLDTVIDALSGVVDYDYDDHDNVTEVIATNGATTTYVYDELDNVTSEVSPDRGTITYTYDDAGNTLTVMDARSVTATYAYDALNRVTSISYPSSSENVTYTYDNVATSGVGRVATISDESGTTTYSYNGFGEITNDSRLISGVTLATSYSYDAMGRVSSLTYPSGRTIAYSRDVLGQTTQVTSTKSGVAKNIVTGATYEPFGPLKSMTYGNGLTFDYDHRTDYRVDAITSGSLHDVAYNYDPTGNVASIENQITSSQNQLFAYDALNRLTSEEQGAALPYSSVVLADNPVVYWRLGEPSGTTVTDLSSNGNGGTYVGNFSLGQTGLITGTDTAMRSNTTGSGYAIGPVLTGTTVTGISLWFQTDNTSKSRYIVALHKANQDRIIVQHGKTGEIGVYLNKAGAVFISDTVFPTNTPHHVAVWYESGSDTTYMMINGVQQQNTYAGNILAVTDPRVYAAAYGIGSSSIGKSYIGEIDEIAIYDTSVSASTFSAHYTTGTSAAGGTGNEFTYDANGNRLTVDDGTSTSTLAYASASNTLSTIDSVAVQHDSSGNMTADASGTRTYGYDDTGRLSQVFDNNVLTATYSHNAMGQRVRKLVGSANTIFVYDLNGTLLAEHDGAGTLIRDYVVLDGIHVSQVESGETFSYLHFDHLGTPRQATNDSQTIVWRWDGDAFGSASPNEDPDGDSTATTINLRFPGQYFDSEANLNYNYYRTYDPTTGRYLESDPIGLGGGLNTYGYVYQNPLRYSDPYGQSATASGVIVAEGVKICAGSAGAGCAAGAVIVVGGVAIYGGSKIYDACAVEIADTIDSLLKPFQNNLLPLDSGGEEWGRRNGVGADEGRRRAHGVKQRDPMSGATDDYKVDPETGDVVDPEGEVIGNLEDDYQ